MIDALGYAAGFLAMLSFLPQVMKTLRTRRASDLSLSMLVLTFTTNVLYVVYGLLLNLYPIVIMIGVMSLLVGFQIVLTLRFGKSAEET